MRCGSLHFGCRYTSAYVKCQSCRYCRTTYLLHTNFFETEFYVFCFRIRAARSCVCVCALASTSCTFGHRAIIIPSFTVYHVHSLNRWVTVSGYLCYPSHHAHYCLLFLLPLLLLLADAVFMFQVILCLTMHDAPKNSDIRCCCRSACVHENVCLTHVTRLSCHMCSVHQTHRIVSHVSIPTCTSCEHNVHMCECVCRVDTLFTRQKRSILCIFYFIVVRCV